MSQSQLAVLFPHTKLLSPTRPYLVLPASVCLGPMWKFFSYYQLMVLGSKLSSLEIGSDSPEFAQLNSWFSFVLTSVGTGDYLQI